ncbi:C-X-C chemokine receptor type 3-like isoform X1 [Perca fluviatilis]|nr:C-X-C chemokine receptor type 3-like isoform X1 [Perca fluviatilis]XP_039661504.1 C-X-C chemokine receptor type 3-like isoform X1 [Perca fluviatilis]
MMNMDVVVDGILLQNSTYDYGDYHYVYEGDTETRASKAVFIPVLYSVELVIGLLGNGLLLAVLAQKRQSWSISDTFILHLSVADILLLATLPFWAAQATQQCGWCFWGFLCKICGAVFNINFYCGIFLLVCISLDRYLSIVHATQLYSQKKPRLAHISCLSVWLVSLILTIPHWIFLVATKDECVHSYTQSVTDWKLASRLLHHTLGFLLPAVTLIICCSCIPLQLKRSTEGLQKQRAIMVILPLVVAFFLCWMPYNITLIVDTIMNSANEPDTGLSGNPQRSLKKALMVTSGLGCMHACLRPLLYLGLCGNFRKRTLAMLKRTTVESESSLWELGVGEEAPPDQSRKEQEPMTSVDHQMPSSQC